MADYGSQAMQMAQQRSQAADSEAANDAYADQMRRQSDLSAAFGGGYGESPNYQPGGAAPKRDFGYEEYLSHILGTTHFNPGGIAVDGPYAGAHHNDLIEKARDAYANMAPEERAPWERRVHNEDVRSSAENSTQGFQYDDQRDRWGAKGRMFDPTTGQPRTLSTLPEMQKPSFQPLARAVYQPSGQSGSRMGSVSMDTGGPAPSGVVANPAMTAPPSYHEGSLNGMNPNHAIGDLQAQNRLTDQAMGRRVVPTVGSGSFSSALPGAPSSPTMSSDTSSFGPRITSASIQSPSFQGGQPTMMQQPQAPPLRPSVAPAPALASARR
jgi:hypothetical protein